MGRHPCEVGWKDRNSGWNVGVSYRCRHKALPPLIRLFRAYFLRNAWGYGPPAKDGGIPVDESRHGNGMIRAAGGRARHTFGSDPDAVGWVSKPTEQRGVNATAPAVEMPARPIWWLAARERAADELVQGEQGRVVTRLLAHVEQAWDLATELAGIADDYPPPREPTTVGEIMVRLLGFVRFDVVELFTRLAFTCSTMVPAQWDTHPEYPSPDEIESMGERFSRNVLMVRLASSDPLIPEVPRERLRRLSGDLLEWFPDFTALAVAASRLTQPR